MGCFEAPSTQDLNDFVQKARQERARQEKMRIRRRLQGKQPPPKVLKRMKQQDAPVDSDEESPSVDEGGHSDTASDSDCGYYQDGQFAIPTRGMPPSSIVEVFPKAGRNGINELRALSS